MKKITGFLNAAKGFLFRHLSIVVPASVTAAFILFVVIVVLSQTSPLSNKALAYSDPSAPQESTAVLSTETPLPETASPETEPPATSSPATETPATDSPETESPAAESPSPSAGVIPQPTPVPPPCDFLTADLKGANAGAMERLLADWGFGYYKPNGKWAADDAYELSLFQRWAKLKPSGLFDSSTRQALLDAWQKYGGDSIPRKKLALEGRYVGINAGHQSKADYGREPLSPEKGSPRKARVSSGTQGVSTRVPEYKVNLAVALKLRDALEALGARTLMVRTVNDVRISNVERCELMNKAHVDLSISIHCDGNNNRSQHGLHTLIPANKGYQRGAVLGKSQLFAKIIQQESIKATGARDAGLSTRRDLSGFNWSKVPTCLVEMGFMSYAKEDRLLVKSSYQDKLAAGFAAGIVRYFKQVR